MSRLMESFSANILFATRGIRGGGSERTPLRDLTPIYILNLRGKRAPRKRIFWPKFSKKCLKRLFSLLFLNFASGAEIFLK